MNKTMMCAIAMIAAGCATDDEGLGETTDAVSIAPSPGTATTNHAVMLTPVASTTCWIESIAGQFSADPLHNGDPASKFDPSRVAIEQLWGSWFLVTHPGKGSGLSARAKCINVPWQGASHEFSFADNLSGAGMPLSPNRHCFLKEVWATMCLYNSPTFNFRSQIALGTSTGEWSFYSSFVDNWGGDYDYGGATAVCVDLPTTGTWSNTFNGPINTVVRSSDSTPVPTSNVACGLRGIGGEWDKGATASLDDSGSSWTVTATAGATAMIHCVR